MHRPRGNVAGFRASRLAMAQRINFTRQASKAKWLKICNEHRTKKGQKPMKERIGSISYNIKEALEKEKVDYCDWKLAVNTLRKTVQGQAAFTQICEVAQLHVSPTNTVKQQITPAVLRWWESIKKSTKKSTNKTATNTNAKSCIPKPSRKL